VGGHSFSFGTLAPVAGSSVSRATGVPSISYGRVGFSVGDHLTNGISEIANDAVTINTRLDNPPFVPSYNWESPLSYTFATPAPNSNGGAFVFDQTPIGGALAGGALDPMSITVSGPGGPGGGSACSTDLQGSVHPVANGTEMTATFTPPVSLLQAAHDCGVVNFDWRQEVLSISGVNPFFDINGNPLTAPWPDPPPGGYDPTKHTITCNGKTYGFTYPNGNLLTSYPFAYDPAVIPQYEVGGFTLTFSDIPADPCIPTGQAELFETALVGVSATNTLVNLPMANDFWFWTDTFNGTVLNTAVIVNHIPVDPGSGTGGVEIVGAGAINALEPPSASILLLGASLCMLLSASKRKLTKAPGSA
jgi:hypothetical protein